MWWIKLKARFSKGGAARDVATLTFGTAIAQVIAVAATPLLTRLYTPSDFGVLAVFLAISGVAATLVTLRYETAILVSSNHNEAATAALLSLGLALVGSAVLALSSLLMPAPARDILGLSNLGFWLPLAFVVSGATAALSTIQGWLNREKQYVHMSILRIFQSTLIVALAIAFASISNIGDGMLWAQTLACGFSAVIAIYFLRSAAKSWHPSQIAAVARLHQNAPRYLLPTAILDVATLQLPLILIALWYGHEAAGQFSMALRVLSMPMALIGAAVGQVFFQRISVEIHNDISLVLKRYVKTSALLAALAAGPVFMISIWGETVFEFFMGSNWSTSGQLAELLIISTAMYFVFSPTSSILLVLNRHKILLTSGIFQLIYRTTAAIISIDIMMYAKILVAFEFINVIIFEILVIYSLKTHKNGEAKQ